jgi:hypothetical protein
MRWFLVVVAVVVRKMVGLLYEFAVRRLVDLL